MIVEFIVDVESIVPETSHEEYLVEDVHCLTSPSDEEEKFVESDEIEEKNLQELSSSKKSWSKILQRKVDT